MLSLAILSFWPDVHLHHLRELLGIQVAQPGKSRGSAGDESQHVTIEINEWDRMEHNMCINGVKDVIKNPILTLILSIMKLHEMRCMLFWMFLH